VPTPSSSLVTGYDFLADAANAVKSELAAGTGATPDTLITPANVSPLDPELVDCDAAADEAARLASRPRLPGRPLQREQRPGRRLHDQHAHHAARPLERRPDELDRLQRGLPLGLQHRRPRRRARRDRPARLGEAFARKRATLVAGTGYQYGDTDFLEYSERLYLEFRQGSARRHGAVPVGQALVDAKQQYLAGTQLLEGLHQKAVIEATLFGLPMLSVNLPAGRGGAGGGGGSVVGGRPRLRTRREASSACPGRT
jgi:hypothetical protein